MALLAKPLVVQAAKNLWNNLIDSTNPENSQLVKHISKFSGEKENGTYTFQIVRDTGTFDGIKSLVGAVGGLMGNNMSMIVIWGLDKKCYDDLSISALINGGISLIKIGNILGDHCFYPGNIDEIFRHSILGQVTVRYKVYKKEHS